MTKEEITKIALEIVEKVAKDKKAELVTRLSAKTLLAQIESGQNGNNK